MRTILTFFILIVFVTVSLVTASAQQIPDSRKKHLSVPQKPLSAEEQRQRAAQAVGAGLPGAPPGADKPPVPMSNASRQVQPAQKTSGVANKDLNANPSVQSAQSSHVVAVPLRTRDDARFPRAIVDTTLGKFIIVLYPHHAPKAVENFIALARGEKEFHDPVKKTQVKRRFYDGLKFHKIVAGKYVQTGSPAGDTGPGYSLDLEVSSAVGLNEPGMVAMAQGKEKSAHGSQFFITVEAMPSENGRYSVFGKIEDGLQVVRSLAQKRASAPVIRTITIFVP